MEKGKKNFHTTGSLFVFRDGYRYWVRGKGGVERDYIEGIYRIDESRGGEGTRLFVFFVGSSISLGIF